jgi:hypothetical protein
MIDVMVIRGAGERSGEDISGILICAVEPAIARGRQEIEARAPAVKVSLRTVARAGVRKGQIIEVNDALQGPSWRGVILGISHVIEDNVIYSVLDVERPL